MQEPVRFAVAFDWDIWPRTILLLRVRRFERFWLLHWRRSRSRTMNAKCGPPRRSHRLASAITSKLPMFFREVGENASPWLENWCASRISCCSMNRPTISTCRESSGWNSSCAASFAYLVATHDRAFLRAVADEIIEVSRVYPGGFFRSAGTYDDFADRRDEFLEAQQRRQEAVANQVRRETDWLAHKARARTRKASSRIEEAGRRREELDELKYRTATTASAGIDFVATGRQTRKLLTATGISRTIENRSLFSGLDLLLSPGTKLGLLGPNGSGKSSLLRVLSGEIDPDTGMIIAR